ncbi:LCP family protein required for cell wall assembly [Planomicrobium koreense]|uniref:LCP family protein required for cell wall assembly n=1 Tax=Planococcus koreensis TaxID=112331 RepID=A0A7W8CPG8_9BACL|nr:MULTISPECIES: LCP family protein [Planococcus]MBB5179220.1 LCP family protein required for cell wall assembly [Planococcus koreensis]MDN3451184.1 LCP family protein [Planococcus sp. APC 3906]
MFQKKSSSLPKKKKNWFGIFVKISIVIGALYLLVLFPKATSTLDEIHEPLVREASPKRQEKVVLEDKDPISVLLLGVDERAGDRGRSDTMVVVAINPEKESTKMISIPRDTYTEIVGLNMSDKINHAYAFGGIEMSMDSAENLLDIPIDYVVQLNMEGFEDIVDALDGVKVENSFAFDDFAAGELTLNGKQALDYVRMRYNDPDGDFGRQNRQKQVIQSIMTKAVSAKTLFNYPKIFNALGNNVKTNMGFNEMIDVQNNYRDATNDLEQLYFEKGYGETIGGIWYYMMDKEELAEVQTVFKEQLEINP